MRVLWMGFVAAFVASCSSRPGATSLPADEAAVQHLGARHAVAQPGTVRPLQVDGVKGGSLTFNLPGRVEDVLAMLLDFDAAEGHRPWADHYHTLSRTKSEVKAEWKFGGKMGINPTVEMVLDIRDHSKQGAVVRYRLTKAAFGLAAFFGDYRLKRITSHPPRVQVTERVFIDSGLPFVNASKDDIAEGLKEDAKQMRKWMRERTQSPE